MHESPTVVGEDDRLKVANFKHLSNPERRDKLYGWVTDTLANGGLST